MGRPLRGEYSGVRRVLDVAGGSGCFCIALALRYPGMRLTAAGLPALCTLTQAYVAEYGLQVIA
jgi:3-hydroxy-5-methyl-1-naphthoate 3-O-methyltransferase